MRSGTFAGTPPEKYPLLLHYPTSTCTASFDLYRKQHVKQADLVLAMYLCPDAFTAEQKARNFEYYEPLTGRPDGPAGPRAQARTPSGSRLSRWPPLPPPLAPRARPRS